MAFALIHAFPAAVLWAVFALPASLISHMDMDAEFASSVDTGFSFSGEVKRQAEESEAGGENGGAKRRRNSGQGRHSEDAGSECAVEGCNMPCAANKNRCWVHKRAQDVLYNMFVKGKDPE
eukprot:8231131-Alexandrium_andersonii.AAC.1